ncbi:hypothetical protein A2U01_0085220, partial [Trifolium medium]|nr:hypothetical protein [Trifolium medium]
ALRRNQKKSALSSIALRVAPSLLARCSRDRTKPERQKKNGTLRHSAAHVAPEAEPSGKCRKSKFTKNKA